MTSPQKLMVQKAGTTVRILKLVDTCSSLITFTSQPLHFNANSPALNKQEDI
jgi:hypothetical protein